MNGSILAGDIVYVIGCDEFCFNFAGDSAEAPVNQRLLREPVILQLQVEIFRAEDLAVAPGQFSRLFIAAPVQQRGDLPGQAAAQGDQPRAVFCQQLVIDARFVVKSFNIAGGDDPHEVTVTLLVLR